jgi:hypothetical protein
MFSDSEKKAWKSISAPEELRERVLKLGETGSCKKRFDISSRSLNRFGTIAACFVLMLVLSAALFIPKNDDFTVSFEGTVLGDNTVEFTPEPSGPAIVLTREVDPIRQTFEFVIEAKGETAVTVSGGDLYRIDGESTLLCVGGSHTFDRNAVMVYTVSANDGDEFQITIQRGKNTQIIKITYNELTNSWSVRKITAD